MRRLLFCLLLGACAAAAPSSDELDLHAQAFAERACETANANWGGWRKHGVVRGLPEAAQANDGSLAPALVEREGVLHLWYAEKTGSHFAIMYSESRDGGESFAAPTRATGLGDAQLSAYPFVWRENGSYKLLFGSGTFKLATSDDGVHFTRNPSAVLGASFDPERFDAYSIAYPNRVSDGVNVTLFFSGFDGHHMRIGRAGQQADGSFSVDPPRPVVELGAATEFDNAAVAQPHVQHAFGRWWMWYGGYDTSHSNPGPYRIGSASSVDGLVWKKHGVVIELSENGSDAWSTRDPALVPWAGRWLMFYVGLGDDGRYRLHRASSDVCSP